MVEKGLSSVPDVIDPPILARIDLTNSRLNSEYISQFLTNY